MKRQTVLVLVAAVVLALWGLTAFSGCTRTDVNCDGEVNVIDVQLVVNSYLGE